MPEAEDGQPTPERPGELRPVVSGESNDAQATFIGPYPPGANAPGTQAQVQLNQLNIADQRQLNIHQGLNLPPADQIERYEVLKPGFTSDLVNIWREESSARHELKRSELIEPIASQRELERMKHEFYMAEMEKEHERYVAGLLVVGLILVALVVAGITALFLGKYAAGITALVGGLAPVLIGIITSTGSPRRKSFGSSPTAAPQGEWPKHEDDPSADGH